MSATEKDTPESGGPNGTGSDESRDRMLDRNIAALLSETPDPPRMEHGARERILASLKDRVAKQDAPAPAASPGLSPGEVEEVRPEPAGPLPAVEERRARGFRIPVSVVAVTVAVVGVGAGLVGYHVGTRSEKKEQARVQEHREKEFKQELAKLKKEQGDLRKINREKDRLLRKLQQVSQEERLAIQAKLARLRKRAQALADNVAKRKRRRARKAGRRGSAPLPSRRPAAAKKMEALHGL